MSNNNFNVFIIGFMKSAIILVIIFTSFINIVFAQISSAKEVNVPLKLYLTVDKNKICLGEKFIIKARLVNISNKAVIIDNRNLWRSVIYRADDFIKETNSPSESNLSFSNLLRVPTRFSIIMGDNFEDDEVPLRYLVTLSPHKSYQNSLIIKSKEDFFQVAGKYYIKSDYRQYNDWSSKNGKLFIGNIESNELVFDLSNCKNSL